MAITKGESVFQHCGALTCGWWLDKRDVSYISTLYRDESEQVERQAADGGLETVNKPGIITHKKFRMELVYALTAPLLANWIGQGRRLPADFTLCNPTRYMTIKLATFLFSQAELHIQTEHLSLKYSDRTKTDIAHSVPYVTRLLYCQLLSW